MAYATLLSWRAAGGPSVWAVRLVGAAIVAIAAALVMPAAAAAQVAYAVTASNTLIRFDPRAPGTVTTIGAITTFPAVGIQLLTLDFRPFDGRLFGVGSDGAIYEVNVVTAAATTPTLFPPTPHPFTGAIGADFDPMPGPPGFPTDPIGRLRIITDAGEHVRRTAEGGGDGANPLFPASQVSAIAFSRNFVGTDRRTLYGIDHGSNALVRIGDADATDDGTSHSQGFVHVIGPLGVDPAADIGFDITPNDGVAYASMGPAGDPESTLYRIDLQTGAATPVGAIAAGERIRALAILARSVTIYLLSTSREIVTLKSAAPGTLLHVARLSPSPETLLGIDARPATGDLYGLTNAQHLVVINPVSGLMRQVATVSGVTLTGTRASLDFNPLTDRLHVLTDTGQHVSIAPDTGAATAEPVTGAAGVTSFSFTNNRADAFSTTLVALNTTTDQFGRIDDPSTTGTFVPIGPLGMDAGTRSTLDVSAVDQTIVAAIREPSSAQTTLAVIDPTTGAVTSIGTIPDTITVEDMAIASPGRVRFARAGFSVPESDHGDDKQMVIERVGDVAEPISVTIERPGVLPVTLRFASGERTKVSRFLFLPDSIQEPDEQITLALVAPEGGATLAAPSTTVMTIVDDDTPLAAGARPWLMITTPTGEPMFASTAAYIAIAGRVDDADGTLAVHPIAWVRWVNDRGFSGDAVLEEQDTPGVDNSSVSFSIGNVPLVPGVNIITVTAADQQGYTHFDTIVVTLDALKYVLAEGALSDFFDTDLLLANPNVDVAPVTIEYLKAGGGRITTHEFLGARTRRTITVDDVPELAGVGEVSMVVTADPSRPVVVERTMRWGEGRYGAHTDKATAGAQRLWYFAEGSQGTFFTYILLANPNAVGILARVVFVPEGHVSFYGNPPPYVEVSLPPFSRRTVDAGSVPRVPGTSFGIQVFFLGGPGVAERAMYFGTAPLWVGGHESAGVNEPSTEWYLAEGATGSFFTTFILLANTGADANVDITFFPADGPPVQKPRFVLRALSRMTLNIAEQDPSLADAAVATRVVSDSPIIVERAQYWPNPFPNWYEAHNSFGVTSLGTRWGLAEGRVGGPESYQTYILLANPGTVDAQVTVTFLRESGTPLQHVVTVPAGRRFNVQVDGSPGGIDLQDERFGALIESTQPIVVERAMYGNAAGQVWQTGTNAVGTRLPQ